MSTFNFGWIPQIQQELRRYFASTAQGALADSALQPAAIGSTVQPFDSDLQAIAGLTGTGGLERTGTGAAATYPLTAYGKSLVAAANASDGRGVLGVTIGANVQAWNTNLDAIAGLSSTGIIERTGPGTYSASPTLGTSKLSADVLERLMPPGAVLWWPGTTPPSGWIKANGALLSRSTYAGLWAAAQASGNLAASDGAWVAGQFSPGDGSTTFRVPDLRGQFLRSWDDGRGIDTGRALGSSQADAFQGHRHSLTYLISSGSAVNAAQVVGASSALSVEAVVTGPSTDGVNGTPRTARETRPLNLAYLHIIKY
jgi:microcystin-dependent protein